MKKAWKIWVVGIVLILLLAGLAVWQSNGTRAHYAVYLTTGDVYFGRIVRFPAFGLKDVYLLQVNARDEKNPVNVQKFSSLFWGPGDFMKINERNVAWKVPLNKKGGLAKLIRENSELVAPPAYPVPVKNNADENDAGGNNRSE